MHCKLGLIPIILSGTCLVSAMPVTVQYSTVFLGKRSHQPCRHLPCSTRYCHRFGIRCMSCRYVYIYIYIYIYIYNQFRANLPALQLSTPLPPLTVHLLRRFDTLTTINKFEILFINILISLCSSEMNGSFRYCTIRECTIHLVTAQSSFIYSFCIVQSLSRS